VILQPEKDAAKPAGQTLADPELRALLRTLR
jgi:hypothetical protein